MKATRGWAGCLFGLYSEWGNRESEGTQTEVEIKDRKLSLRLLSWKRRRQKDVMSEIYAVSEELLAKTALLIGGLLPAAIYADALQEEIPEAEWAAQQLREWAKWTDSN